MRRRSGLAANTHSKPAPPMDILDKQIREELMARLERDPNSLAFHNTSATKGCLTIAAVLVAFGCGFAFAALWFT